MQDKVGEVWFPAGDLLVKFLFTSENLSVQVHPGDDYARENENSPGKTEMWYVLRAEPGAKVALGFRTPIEKAALPALALSGAVMDHLAWYEACPGDTFFIPAGVVHAIGAGLVLCEIQQNSDITYRIFDYGRSRELHLARALDVADCECREGRHRTAEFHAGRSLLAKCEHFATEKLEFRNSIQIEGSSLVIFLEGEGRISGNWFTKGTVWNVSKDSSVSIEPCGAALALYVQPGPLPDV